MLLPEHSSAWGLPEKKTLHYRQSQNNEELLEHYQKKLKEAVQANKHIVYMDETGFAPSTYRLYGWASVGERVYGLRDAMQWPRTSLIGAYSGRELTAPMLFDGTCTTALFNIWLTQELLPLLPKGTVIVLDNAAFHHSKSTEKIVEEGGCVLLFLPPYSPHLNPIEKLWANIKRFWRNVSDLSLDEMLLASGYLGD